MKMSIMCIQIRFWNCFLPSKWFLSASKYRFLNDSLFLLSLRTNWVNDTSYPALPYKACCCAIINVPNTFTPTLHLLILENSADCVKVLTNLGGTWQGLEVLQMPPSIFLVMPYIIDDISYNHCEPTKHGDKHGHIGSLMVEVTKVYARIQDLDDRLAGVLFLNGGVAAHLIYSLGIQPEFTQHLLKCALTVPRVVGQADLGMQPSECLLRDALHVIMRQVEHPQALRDTLKSPSIHGFNGVPWQVQLLEPGKVFKSLVWDFGDVIGGQKKGHSLMRKVGGNLFKVARGTLHYRQAIPLGAVATLGTRKTHCT